MNVELPTNRTPVSIEQFARLTGRTIEWLTAQARAGRIPSTTADGKLVFDLAAVEKLLARRPPVRWGGDLARMIA